MSKNTTDKVSIWDRQDVDIERVGTKITLPNDPEPMPIPAAMKALKRKLDDEEQELDVHELIESYPKDGLVAVYKAMVDLFGWASPSTKIVEGMFGPQEIKPQLISIKTGPKADDVIQVPYGEFSVPNVESAVEIKVVGTPDGSPAVAIIGCVKKREKAVLVNIAKRAREILVEESIYKGKAFTLPQETDGSVDYHVDPAFLDTDVIKKDELILNPIELDQVQTALWTPIENTDACIEQHIPLNRGVLLEGTYGTGKTMTAQATARVCHDNGWTFIMIDDVRGLATALKFAQRYQPAVVFAEDIDRAIAQRDQTGNDLLNTIDGVLSKNSQVITVLTTNHVERLEKAMLRPGRLDAVISVKPPEAEAVGRLIRLYARDRLHEDATLEAVGLLLAGNIPATIREVTERAKLAMIHRKDTVITDDDLTTAAHGMEAHLKLLENTPPQPSAGERLGQALFDVLMIETPDSMVVSQRRAGSTEYPEASLASMSKAVQAINKRLS